MLPVLSQMVNEVLTDHPDPRRPADQLSPARRHAAKESTRQHPARQTSGNLPCGLSVGAPRSSVDYRSRGETATPKMMTSPLTMLVMMPVAAAAVAMLNRPCQIATARMLPPVPT
jgi:hypothetical protein